MQVQSQPPNNAGSQTRPLIPVMLNILTILTFIGCATAALRAVINYFSIGSSYNLISKINDDMESESTPRLFKNLINLSVEVVRKQYEYREIFFWVAIVCVLLCFWGAVQMRNLKKQGFVIYSIGELLYPLVFGFLIDLGGIGFTSLLVPIVFVILYATQRKCLVN